MNIPTISVVMANYNHGHYISQALDAILRQSLLPTEIVIVDDASTDNSVEIIEQFSRRSGLIRLLSNATNIGGAASAHRALMASHGELIVGQSADDIILPGYIEKSVSLLSRYPEAGLCVSHPASFKEGTNLLSTNPLGWGDEARYFSPEELADTINGGYIPGHSSVIRRVPFLEAGGHIKGLAWHCDWFANLVIGFRHGICYLPEPLAVLRVHASSYSQTGRSNWQRQKEVLAHLLHLIKSPPYSDVFPYFVRGSIMSHFGDENVHLISEYPELLDNETLMLIQRPLNAWLQRMNQGDRDTQLKTLQKIMQNNYDALYSGAKSTYNAGNYKEAFDKFNNLVTKFSGTETGFWD